MSESFALVSILVLPLAGALFVPLLRASSSARAFALAAMLVVLALALRLVVGFEGGAAAVLATYRVGWWPALGNVHFAVDGLNVYLLLLTAVLFPVVLGCSWRTRECGSRLYLALMLALEAGLLFTFLAQNLLVLFVAWEAVLIPMVLMILAFGGSERRRAAMTFFLWTMAGSVLFLAAVILLGVQSLRQTGHWAFDFATLSQVRLDAAQEAFVFVALALACAIKSPLVPFHAWLPLTYREAPASATALMAGAMSKMGAYGLLKLVLPLAPTLVPLFAPWIVALGAVSILYGALLALRERNAKQLVAYASLSHMGYIFVGVFSLRAVGLHGALLQMLSHGLAVAGLFLLLGALEQRLGPAYLDVRALATRAPRFAVTTMLFILASLALPLTSGFAAEFMVLLGAFGEGVARWQAHGDALMLGAALLAALGVVLGATYMLRFARTLLFDADPTGASVPELRAGEMLALAPLLLLILWIGAWPSSFMAKAEPAVAGLVRPSPAVPPIAADTPAARVRHAR